MDVRVVQRRREGVDPPRARGGRRSRDGPPQLRDHGPALGRVRRADRNCDEREAEGCLLPHPEAGRLGTGRDLRRGPWRGDGAPEGSRRRRDDPGPRRPRLRQVAHPPGPRRRIPADDRPDCDRRGTQPIRRAARTPEAGRRRRETLPKRSPRADPGAEAISDLPDSEPALDPRMTPVLQAGESPAAWEHGPMNIRWDREADAAYINLIPDAER